MNLKDWAKENWKSVLEILLNEYNPSASDNPAASFMAGAPGAGKTEYSTRLVSAFSSKPLIIDVDRIKTLIPTYTGNNTDVVKEGAMKVLEKVLDHSIKNGLPFLLDGTFSGPQSIQNLKRVHRSKRGFVSQVYFVYQDPERAWEFTKIRAAEEGRSIPKGYFIKAYLKSMENLNIIESDPEVGSRTTTVLIIKDYLEKTKEYTVADSISNLDKYVERIYNEVELRMLLDD